MENKNKKDNPHSCKNLFIRCMDFRLNKEVDKWIKEEKLSEGGFDLISVAGASKTLADGTPEEINYFLNNIAVSMDLHQAEKIIIFHHSNCGAYAQSYKFESSEAEKEKQLQDMRIAKEVILNKYPEVEVVFVWGELKDDNGGEIEFEKIK